MKFTWDKQKNRSNLEKHGLDFKDAHHVFESQTITLEDVREDYQEKRYITMGEIEGRCVIVVHTPRGNNRRIISMRKANGRETKSYQERLRAHRQAR